ncbi:MAG: hypothetical protein J6B92_07310 [Paraprevotella sp.]|nr:hypothetical protein [Paraprevotella sp.]
MISIIVCSRLQKIPNCLKQNIEDTIGDVSYEIIWIHNKNNQYSIYEAYDLATHKAHFDYLCFMHEDILFHTKDWGIKILDLMQDAENGLLGVIGGHHLGLTAHCWAYSQIVRGQILQGTTTRRGRYKTNHIKLFNQMKLGNEVVTVDGLWMCIKKSLFDNQQIKWDSEWYKTTRFHFYDMDICMQVNMAGYKVRVVDDLLIEHTSAGYYDEDFIEASRLFHKKWDDYLPIQRPCNMPTECQAFIRDVQLNAINNNYIKNSRMRNLMINSPFRFLCTYISWLLFKRSSTPKVKGIEAFCIDADSLL